MPPFQDTIQGIQHTSGKRKWVSKFTKPCILGVDFLDGSWELAACYTTIIQ
jgi:hypothetical protein